MFGEDRKRPIALQRSLISKRERTRTRNYLLVSIIIPTFNRCTFLRQAIQSVLDQTFRDWELIIVDDGSTDASQQKVVQFRDRRIHYVFQNNSGVSTARNTGIQLARFPWISFLDSDDYWNPLKLQRQIEELEDFPCYRVIYTNEVWIRHGQRVNPRKVHQKHSGWIYHHCLSRCLISPSSVLLHRRVLDEEGYFDDAFRVCEDYEMWLRISAHRPILFLDEPLIVKVGGHSDQLSRSMWGMDRLRVQALYKNYKSGNLTPLQKRWTANEIARKATILARGFAKHQKQEEARKYEDFARRMRSSLDGARSEKNF